MGGAHALETAYHELLVAHAARLRPATIVMVMNNAATGQIAIDLNIRGPSYTYSSACSSSAVAIGEAFRAVRFGLVKTAIAGGAEALLSEGVMKARLPALATPPTPVTLPSPTPAGKHAPCASRSPKRAWHRSRSTTSMPTAPAPGWAT